MWIWRGLAPLACCCFVAVLLSGGGCAIEGAAQLSCP